MNQKFSIKIAALLATFTGTAVGPTDLLPLEWLASAQAQPPIVSPVQAKPGASSNMLAPITAPAEQPSQTMPWQADRSKYRAAITPDPERNPGLMQEASATQKPDPRSAVRKAVGTAIDQQETSVQPAAAQFAAPDQAQVPAGFSSAGVPLYAPTKSQTAPAPFARMANAATSASKSYQGSGSRSVIGSGIQADPGFIAPPADTMPPAGFMAPPSMPAPPVISPGSEMIMGLPSSSMGTIQSGEMSSVISQAPVTFPETGYTEPGIIETAPGPGSSCDTCSTNTTGAVGCESCGGCNCGPGGCYNADDIASKAGLFGSVGEARYYSHLEALIMDRQDGDVLFTPSLQLGGFDADIGYRFTLGERFDAINGRELSYWGTGNISNSQTLDGTTFPLNQVFQTTDSTRTAIAPFGFFTEGQSAVAGVAPRPAGTFGPSDPGFAGSPPVPGVPSTLIRPTEQTQSAETYFHTIEFNRVRWAWDVFKSFAGIRYIYVNDRYELNSTATVPINDTISVISRGTYTNLAQNHLIGPHIGGEWFYDVGYRLSASVNLKGGIYANLNEVDTRLFRDGDAFVDREAENTAFASSLELGLHAHYQIAPRGRFRAGFNVLHLEDVASVTQNFPGVDTDADGTIVRSISLGSGTGANDNDNMTFTGFSFGLEFFR